jgi:outer membrane protein assembly factor BamB
VPGLDNLYLGLADGRTVALALKSGAVVWTRETGGRASGLTALDDQLLVGTTSGQLVSLELRSGRQRWRFRTGAGVVAAPAADDRRLFVVAYDHVLRALDRRHGQLRWKRALPHRPAGGPLVTGGTVLVPVFATELQGFDASTGTPSLTMTTASEVTGALRVRLGGGATATRLTAVSTEGQLIALGPRIEEAPVPLGALPGTAVPEPPPVQPPPAGSPPVR